MAVNDKLQTAFRPQKWKRKPTTKQNENAESRQSNNHG